MPIEKCPHCDPRAAQERRADKQRTRDRRATQQKCAFLHRQCSEIEFDCDSQREHWKNEVARDLMTLLGRAQYFLETDRDESDVAAAQATLRIVRRVEEFEGIRRAK